jgi:hypothetical protein
MKNVIIKLTSVFHFQNVLGLVLKKRSFKKSKMCKKSPKE